MKKFKLMMMAGLLAFAGSAMAQGLKVISAEDVTLADDGTGVISVNLDYTTTETVVGYNFSLMLPEGIAADSKSGKWAPAVTLSDAIHPLLYDSNADDYTASATKAALQIKDKTDGGLLFVWIDQAEALPLLSLQGELMSIKIKAADGFTGGEAKIYLAGVTSDKNVSLDLGNIADVTFSIIGTTVGINDVKSADATAPAYNLQGVRVNESAKGLIIRDGKKTIVK